MEGSVTADRTNALSLNRIHSSQTLRGASVTGW